MMRVGPRATSGLARSVLGAVAISLLVAGCGSSSPSGTPAAPVEPTAPAAASATTPIASEAPATPAATPVGSLPPEGTPVPSFTRDAALEALLPATLLGQKIVVSSLRGTDILASGRPEDIAALNTVLDGLGKTPKDYAFAYSIIQGTSLVGVFKIAGADPEKVRDLLIKQTKDTANGVSVESGTIGGKKVQIVRVPGNGTLTSGYFWPSGDVLWYVQTGDPTIAERVLAEL